jgi:hypothetical protein
VTEFLYDDADQPYQFVAGAEELREAIAAIPAAVLREVNERQWTSRGLEAPKRPVRELRASLLAKHERAAESLSTERILPVEEAAKNLGLTGRVLSYRIEQGDFADAVRSLPSGRTGLAFKPPTKRWSLIVDRPDPRVLLLMREQGIKPGASYTWRMAGEESDRVYVRRRDGECWGSPKGAP